MQMVTRDWLLGWSVGAGLCQNWGLRMSSSFQCCRWGGPDERFCVYMMDGGTPHERQFPTMPVFFRRSQGNYWRSGLARPEAILFSPEMCHVMDSLATSTLTRSCAWPGRDEGRGTVLPLISGDSTIRHMSFHWLCVYQLLATQEPH